MRWQFVEAPEGLMEQSAMNAMIVSDNFNETVTVSTFDNTGIIVAHCGQRIGDVVDECGRNLDYFAGWDRALVWLLSWVHVGLWILPLCMAFGIPLTMPGVLGKCLQVNPLAVLAAVGLPGVLSKFLVRNNRVSGDISEQFTTTFSGVLFVTIGDSRQLWVPTIGLLQIPNHPRVLYWGVCYTALFCILVLLGKVLDRWTCITCPTLYHWFAWSKASSDRCSSLTGAGTWLAVVATGPNLHHLECGSATWSEAGVAADTVHGLPANACMRSSAREAGCGALQHVMHEGANAAKVRSNCTVQSTL